jgi:hypothetical protein
MGKVELTEAVAANKKTASVSEGRLMFLVGTSRCDVRSAQRANPTGFYFTPAR